MTLSNPRAVEGNNSANTESEVINEAELEKVMRVCQAEYNRGSQDKRHAAQKMRDEKRDFRAEQAAVYEEIDAIMASARDRMATKLRTREAYAQAEEDKKDASLRMKAALKKLKDAGCDPQAYKIANKMAEMDSVERGDFFDRIDLYCKALRLWGNDDF